jgi:hypothetical protein
VRRLWAGALVVVRVVLAVVAAPAFVRYRVADRDKL